MKNSRVAEILELALDGDDFVELLDRDQPDVEAIVQNRTRNIITLKQITPTGIRVYEITVSVKRLK